jgi:hypothetical protein
MVPPPPWALTPEQEIKISRTGSAIVVAVRRYSFPPLLRCRRDEPKTQSSPGINSAAARTTSLLNVLFIAALLPCVEMLITTLIADAPGVIGVEGLKLHCEPAGNPLVQARVTGALNEAPMG